MPDSRRLFLTINQAIQAIANDLNQYPPQLNTLSTLLTMAFGDDAYLLKASDGSRVWVNAPCLVKPCAMPIDALGGWIVDQMKKQAMSPDRLAGICTRVFQTPVVAAVGDNGVDPAGVWVNTGMDGFKCRQCGRCCKVLNYRNGCSVSDYRRWVASNRDDIIPWVGVVRKKGRIVACRIWMVPGTNRFADACPWLKRADRPNRYVCSIHDVRPSICRQYPGSRKHARMTGCRGV